MTKVEIFLQEVQIEVERAERIHSPINSLHEGYAVLLEEVDEFWDECKKKSSARDKNRLREELVQVAAMAARLAKDCHL